MEGTFDVLKQVLGFRRFLHCGSGNVYKLLYLLSKGFNLAKLHNGIKARWINITLFTSKGTAKTKKFLNRSKGLLKCV